MKFYITLKSTKALQKGAKMRKRYWGSKSGAEEKSSAAPEEAVDLGGMPILMMGGPGREEMPKRHLEVIDNKIFYYGPITQEDMLQLNKAIAMMDKDLQVFEIKYDTKSPPIQLHINSEGGSIHAAMSTVDAIRGCKTPVHSYIDGSAASAGTLISCVADKRFMTKHAMMLIHQLSSGVWGKYDDIKEEVENLDLTMKNIMNVYKTHTSLSKRELKALLSKDIWLTSETCLEYGLVDEII